MLENILLEISGNSKRPKMLTPEKIIARFWSKVVVLSPDECWIWVGAKSNRGYGNFTAGAKGNNYHQWPASRFSWMLTYGDIADNMNVCHRCDNPACVNPAHLFLGTDKDNMEDKVAKSRQAKGETQGRRKLTVTQVRQVFELYNIGWTYGELSSKFGVSVSVIQSILTKRTWAHVTTDLVHNRRPGAKLTKEKVEEIRALALARVPTENIASMYGVSKTHVLRIRRGYQWRK